MPRHSRVAHCLILFNPTFSLLDEDRNQQRMRTSDAGIFSQRLSSTITTGGPSCPPALSCAITLRLSLVRAAVWSCARLSYRTRPKLSSRVRCSMESSGDYRKDLETGQEEPDPEGEP